jgi:hypothetical protein
MTALREALWGILADPRTPHKDKVAALEEIIAKKQEMAYNLGYADGERRTAPFVGHQ